MSKKGITPKDKYICTLSKEDKQIAEEELRETEYTRNSSLDAIREWAEKNPRINKIRMDSNFLLRFLRAKKFSIPMAEEAIERYILLRKCYNGALFQNLDYKRPVLLELINKGLVFALPNRDALGRRILMYNGKALDMSKNTNIELLNSIMMAYETILEDELNQIKGIVHIVDCSNCGFELLTLFTPKEATRILKNGEKIFPMRHKTIAIMNIAPALKMALDLAKPLVSEKIRQRLHLCSSSEEFTFVDKKLLPKEYGGTMPQAEMIELWKNELEANREKVLGNDKIIVNLHMYSQGAQDGTVFALKSPINSCDASEDTNVYGLQGSFRKLEVD